MSKFLYYTNAAGEKLKIGDSVWFVGFGDGTSPIPNLRVEMCTSRREADEQAKALALVGVEGMRVLVFEGKLQGPM